MLCSSGLSSVANGSPYWRPTRRGAAARPRIAASAAAPLDRRVLSGGEAGDVRAGDEDGVEAGALEGGDDVTVGRGYLGDRELSRRHVGEQLEHVVERIGVVRAARRDQEDLRLQPVERE